MSAKRMYRGRMRSEEEIDMLDNARELAYATPKKQKELGLTRHQLVEIRRYAALLEDHGDPERFGR